MSNGINAREELYLNRIKNYQDIIGYNRDETNKAIGFFVKAISLVTAGLVGIMTYSTLSAITVDLFKIGIFLVIVIAIYPIFRLWYHAHHSRRLRKRERNLILEVEHNPKHPVVPDEKPHLDKMFYGVLTVVILLVSGYLVYQIALTIIPSYQEMQINQDWHQNELSRFEVVANKELKGKVKIVSDGWGIFNTVAERPNFYEWGWTISANIIDPSFQGNRDIKITYVLVDENGFELARDEVKDWLNFGQSNVFRHTSIIPKGRALRASGSFYEVEVGKFTLEEIFGG